jgi:hypothetical protein
LIKKSFNAQEWNFIVIRKNIAKWTPTLKSGVCLSCDDVINLVNWLIDNTYVTIVEKVFKQSIGIPMVQIVHLISKFVSLFVRI